MNSISSSYVQNMIENMILMSYSGKSYLDANFGKISRKYSNNVTRQIETPSKSTIFVARQICPALCCVEVTGYMTFMSPAARSSIQKFDNDCDVIFMFKM